MSFCAMRVVCRFDDLLSWKRDAYCLVSKIYQPRTFPRATTTQFVRHDEQIPNTEYANSGGYHSLINDARCQTFASPSPRVSVLLLQAGTHSSYDPHLPCHVYTGRDIALKGHEKCLH